MRHSMKIIPLVFLLFLGTIISGQSNISERTNKGTNYKFYAGIRANKAILSSDTKYRGFDLGLKLKCKLKFGYSYSKLRGNFQSDLYPVDNRKYPAIDNSTRTKARFNAFVLEPIIIKDKKVNISLPIRVGLASIRSEYKASSLSYTEYYSGNSPFTEIGANLDYRILGILKIGVSLSYRYVKSELPVISETFTTPLLGLSLKLGRMCR
jgi:hypothetical protein